MKWEPTQTQIEAAILADKWFMELCEEMTDNPFKCPHVVSYPDYAEDHNATQRLIDGLDDYEICRYRDELGKMFFFEVSKYRATASQKFQAVCKAKGWE